MESSQSTRQKIPICFLELIGLSLKNKLKKGTWILISFEENKHYIFNNYKFDPYYYNKTGIWKEFCFEEFVRIMKTIADNKNFKTNLKWNSYKNNPELIILEIFT